MKSLTTIFHLSVLATTIGMIVALVLLPLNLAHAEINSMPFPDHHGNSTAVAANSDWVLVGTDAGYLEILNRKTSALQSSAIYKGPYRMMTSVSIDGNYGYALVNGVAIYQVDLTTGQLVDQLKASPSFNYLASMQIFAGVAYVKAYSGFNRAFFKLDLKQGKLSELKPQPVQLPFGGIVIQMYMQTSSSGVAVVSNGLSKIELYKFDLQKNSSERLSLPDLDSPRIISMIGDVLYLKDQDHSSTDSRDEAYLAIDLSQGQFVLPFVKSWKQLPLMDFAVSGDLTFAAAWGKGLVVMPTPEKLGPVTQVFPEDLFGALGEKTPRSFHWSCESISQYGIPSEWKVDFGAMEELSIPTQKGVPFTVLIAQRDWQKNTLQYFKRYEKGLVYNEENEFSVRFAKPGGEEWDVEGFLSSWKNHFDNSPLEFKIWLQRAPEISSSPIKLNCVPKS